MLLAMAVQSVTIAENHSAGIELNQNDQDLVWAVRYNTHPITYGKLTATMDNEITSSLSRSLSDYQSKDRWRDNMDNHLVLSYHFSDQINAGLTIGNNRAQDMLMKDRGITQRTFYQFDTVIKPVKQLSLTQTVGQVMDERLSKKDDGVHFTSMIMAKLPFTFRKTGWDQELSINHTMNTMKREMRGSSVVWSLVQNRENAFTVSLGMEGDYEKLGYFSTLEDVPIAYRKRDQERFLFSLGKRALFPGDFSLESSVAVLRGRVTDTTNELQGSRAYRNNSGKVGYELSSRMDTNIFDRFHIKLGGLLSEDKIDVTNNDRSRDTKEILLESDVEFRVFRPDSVQLKGSLNRKRIDTPDGVLNDHDEFKGQLRIAYVRHLSDIGSFWIIFNTIQTHSVNINPSQAGTNKWVRTYLLSPSFQFHPLERLQISHQVDLYANYIDFDFDDIIQPQSNITRRWTSSTQTVLRVTDVTHIDIDLYLEKNDYGTWTPHDMRTLQEEGIRQKAGFQFSHSVTPRFWFKPGYAYLIRRENNPVKNRIKRRDVDETFTIQFEYTPDKRNTLSLNATRAIRKTIQYPVRVRDMIEATYIHHF